MRLLLVRHLWGVTGTWETLFPEFRKLGYQGIECPLPVLADRRRFFRLLEEQGFAFIPQIFTTGATVRDHLASFRAQLKETVSAGPLLVNSHSGLDAWPEEDSAKFFEEALKIEADLGLSVAHETHRSRILFNPWITYRLLQRSYALKLCCDFSHWVCVAERLFEEPAIIRACAEHCIHLHARVGYEQGPQVPDPRAPEYAIHLAKHENWWRTIWRAQHAAGLKTSTLTPEFGPPGYQQTLPFTNAPVSNLAEICDWQAARQAGQFAKLKLSPRR